MFTMIIVILLAWFLTLIGLSITSDFTAALPTFLILMLALSSVFWITHLAISKDKSFRRYDKMWDEPEIIVSGIGYSVLIMLLMIQMVFNLKNGTGFLKGTLSFWLVLIIIDILNVKIVFKTYSFELVESIKDSLLLQIRRVQNGLLLIMIVLATIKFTIVGGVLMAILFAIVYNIFFAAKKK